MYTVRLQNCSIPIFTIASKVNLLQSKFLNTFAKKKRIKEESIIASVIKVENFSYTIKISENIIADRCFFESTHVHVTEKAIITTNVSFNLILSNTILIWRKLTILNEKKIAF